MVFQDAAKTGRASRGHWQKLASDTSSFWPMAPETRGKFCWSPVSTLSNKIQSSLPHSRNRIEVIVAVTAFAVWVGEDENSERDLFTAKHPKYLINLLFIWQTFPSLKVPRSAVYDKSELPLGRHSSKMKRIWAVERGRWEFDLQVCDALALWPWAVFLRLLAPQHPRL